MQLETCSSPQILSDAWTTLPQPVFLHDKLHADFTESRLDAIPTTWQGLDLLQKTAEADSEPYDRLLSRG
jgi:hypothetical protein